MTRSAGCGGVRARWQLTDRRSGKQRTLGGGVGGSPRVRCVGGQEVGAPARRRGRRVRVCLCSAARRAVTCVATLRRALARYRPVSIRPVAVKEPLAGIAGTSDRGRHRLGRARLIARTALGRHRRAPVIVCAWHS